MPLPVPILIQSEYTVKAFTGLRFESRPDGIACTKKRKSTAWPAPNNGLYVYVEKIPADFRPVTGYKKNYNNTLRLKGI